MPKILIVDDEKSIRRTLAEFLRAEGHEVHEAEDADVALRHLSDVEYDVVVTDIILPRVTGVELLRRIQATAPHVQVVMMTGEPTVETAAESLRMGAADYLFKPITKAAIIRVVANAAKLKALDDTKRHLEAENRAHQENLERLVEERTRQLRASEERARELSLFNQAALDALTAHICVLDGDGTILAVNQSWMVFAETNPPMLANTDVGANYLTVCESVQGEEADQAREVVTGLRAVARGELPEFSIEYPCHAPHAQRWFMMRATRFAGADPVRVVVAHVNITDRKQAEQQVRDSESLYQSLVGNLPQQVFRKDLTGRFTFGNDHFCRSLGKPLAEILGKTDLDFFPAPLATKYRADDQKVVASGETFEGEEEHRQGDGQSLWVSVVKTPLRDAAGQIVGLQGISWDITNRRRAEQRLLVQAALLDAATDAIYVKDLDHTVRYWNPAAAKLYGWTNAEAMGHQIAEEIQHDGAATKAARTALREHGHWSGELPQTNKDGRPLTVFARWTLLRDAQGQPERILAINTDLAEKKQLEAQFLRAQRLEGIGALASGIAHDLNNILAPVLMTAPLLREATQDAESRAMLDTVETCAQRGADIIKQLLTFARGTSGARVPLPIRHLLRDMDKMIRETFPRDIRPSVNLPKELWPMLGDATQLHQVLMNLCVNARDAMPDGGTLRLAAKNVVVDEAFAAMVLEAKIGPYVCVSVSDTGTGIAAEHRDRIFDPFFTTKDIGMGTGLGLSTVLGIVVRGHGGFVRVLSEMGKGTTFELYFPASPNAPDAAADQARPLPARGQGELILVVDDEPGVRDSLRRRLEKHGYRVLTAVHGADGLLQFSQHRSEIRAVLTDMMMPVMNGPTMVNALRELMPSLPVLGMTGLPERSGVKGLEHLDLPVLLAKPFSGDDLLRTLNLELESAKPSVPPESAP
ncbi:MAG: hybrid sensor histidine kinase/response regulator [Limisphaerales bacterium]